MKNLDYNRYDHVIIFFFDAIKNLDYNRYDVNKDLRYTFCETPSKRPLFSSLRK